MPELPETNKVKGHAQNTIARKMCPTLSCIALGKSIDDIKRRGGIPASFTTTNYNLTSIIAKANIY